MLIEIKHRFSDAILFSAECANLRVAVELAVKNRVDLSGSNLRNSNLSYSNLRGSIYVQSLGDPNGWSAFTYFYKGHQYVQVGCRNFTLKQGRDYWRGKPNRAEVIAAIDYAESIGRLRKWGEKS